jgi:hypothetical protein
MIKTFYAVAAAAIAAACFVGFPSLAFQVQAGSPVPGAKGDRADVRPAGMDCSQNAWPYFEAACLRDGRNPMAEARPVRVVTADHLADAASR